MNPDQVKLRHKFTIATQTSYSRLLERAILLDIFKLLAGNYLVT